MVTKQKFYAVKKGKQPGIYSSWSECQEATKGYPGAEFKAFLTRAEAESYLQGEDLYEQEVRKNLADGFGVAFVDGSFSEKQGRYGSGVLAFSPHKDFPEELFRAGKNEKYNHEQNVAGEIFAALMAMEWAVSSNIQRLKIYHDYEGIEKWITGQFKANSNIAKTYKAIYEDKYKGILDVFFVKVKGHSNNKYNDWVDSLAKNSLNAKPSLIQGTNFASFSGISLPRAKKLLKKLREEHDGLVFQEANDTYRNTTSICFNEFKIVINHYPTSQKLVLQGSLSPLFQEVLAYFIEALNVNDDRVDRLYSNVYRVKVDSETISSQINSHFHFPSDYPQNIKDLIRSALIMLSIKVDSPDYAFAVFPVLKALEGHLKYLFSKNGIQIGKDGFGKYFDCKLDKSHDLKNRRLKFAKEISCGYNQLFKHRHTLFHYGEICSSIDTTRMLKTKDEANEIIVETLAIMQNEKERK